MQGRIKDFLKEEMLFFSQKSFFLRICDEAYLGLQRGSPWIICILEILGVTGNSKIPSILTFMIQFESIDLRFLKEGLGITGFKSEKK